MTSFPACRTAHRLGAILLLGGATFVGLPAAVSRAQDTGSAPPAAAAAPSPDSAAPPAAPTSVPENHTGQPAFDPLAERIRYLHERLRITPAQEPHWANLAQVMRDNAAALPPLLKARFQAAQHGNALDLLHADENLDAAQLDGLRKFTAAFQDLYGSLSDEQRKIADILFRRSQVSEGAPAPLPSVTYPSDQAAPADPDYSAEAVPPSYPPDYDLPDYGALFLGPSVGFRQPLFLHGRPEFGDRGGHHPGAVPFHPLPHPGFAPAHAAAIPMMPFRGR